MSQEITESVTDQEHILADIHEIAKMIHEFRQEFDNFRAEFGAKVEEWEKIAHPLVAMRDSKIFRNLGKGRQHAVPEDGA